MGPLINVVLFSRAGKASRSALTRGFSRYKTRVYEFKHVIEVQPSP